MEYQSFFMLLKSFSYNNNNFICTNPLTVHGFVQIKKEQQSYYITIQINNYSGKAYAYLVSKTNIAKIEINSATTKAAISFVIENDVCVFVEQYLLFACKAGTLGCADAYGLIRNKPFDKKGKTTLEKIFGEVYDTYFFDCIKPKLAQLFTIGMPINQLSEQIACSKWTRVEYKNRTQVFGVVYKNNFAYAVAVGAEDDFGAGLHAQRYQIEDKIYNILFLSASNGKIISF